MSVVIGIAGGSGSGKTTVQRRVMERFGTRRIALLDHDAYYRPLDHLSPDQRARFNFDHPDALETDLMVAHLDRLLAGEPIEKPTYSFETHSRLAATERLDPRPVILVEGILVLAEPALRERMDVKLFVDAAPDVRLMRRMERDLHERGRSVESVLAQYRRTVRPMHLEFVEPSKRYADVIIPRGGQNQVAIDMVLARVDSLLDRDRA
ncbi:uridine kinase [Rubrivirga sp. IMCC45206]|uniref:uridine kinase n=1 Tax=Rubrivirga sp. IMCC45206 TaxID=3391614 RepID=UPI00399002F9